MGDVAIKSVELMRVLPGDVVVYRADRLIPEAEREELLNNLERLFPGNSVVVQDGGDRFELVREGSGDGA